jgi:hypothetical protein
MEADAVGSAEGSIEAQQWPIGEVPPVGEQGTATTSCRFRRRIRMGHPAIDRERVLGERTRTLATFRR